MQLKLRDRTLPFLCTVSAPPLQMTTSTNWPHLIGCQLYRARDNSKAEYMACSKFSVLMLAITASLCTTWTFSTCSFENTCWWTLVYHEKGENSAHLLSLPQFCSQASSLLAPTVTVSIRAVRVEASSDPTPFWTLPVISTTYAASKATDFYSPVPCIGIAANYFERMASLFSILSMITILTILLFIWMMSLPLISYVVRSSMCENMLSVSPNLQVIVRNKIKEMEELSKY